MAVGRAEQLNQVVLFLEISVLSHFRDVAKSYNFAGLLIKLKRLLMELEVRPRFRIGRLTREFGENDSLFVLVILRKVL